MVSRSVIARFPVGIGLLFAVLYLMGCSTPSAPTGTTEKSTVVPVEVALVERGIATARYSSTAALEAEDEATVVARVDGVVNTVLVEEGQFVRANQPLAKLDDERLALEVQRAEVAVEKLKTAYERSQTMYEKNLVSRESFETAKSEYKSQEVAAKLARLDLAYATIRAPITGWISLRHITPGNMVRAHNPAFEITNLDPLRAVLHVPERELTKLAVDQAAILRFDAVPDRSFEGQVVLIGPVVDPSTGTFRVTVQVRDPSRTIKPGMFGRIDIQYDQREETLLAPKSALVEEDDIVTVFVVRDSLAIQKTVIPGYDVNDRVEILEGLEEGDRIVRSGQATLRDSAHVEII